MDEITMIGVHTIEEMTGEEMMTGEKMTIDAKETVGVVLGTMKIENASGELGRNERPVAQKAMWCPRMKHLPQVYYSYSSQTLLTTILDPSDLQQPIIQNAPVSEDGEAMDDINDEDDAMSAMMGLSGFGTTKASMLSLTAVRLLMFIITGEAGRWQPGGRRQREKDANMAPIYEQVCFISR
jgi:hypothetical protein